MSDHLKNNDKTDNPRNASELPQSELELEYRLLVENVKDVSIFLLDPSGVITSWNEAAEKMKGFSASEIIGQHLRMLYLPEDAEAGRPEEHLRIARETGKFTEKGWRRKKGCPPFWAQVILTPLWDQHRQLRGFAKITHDRTAEYRAEERLREQARITATIATRTAEALFMMDAKGRVTFANAAAEKLLGWKPSQLMGKVLHDLVHHSHPDGTDFPMVDCPLGQVFLTGREVTDHEDYFIHREGHFVPVICSNAPVISEGRVIAAVLAVHDMSHRKKAERAVSESDARFRAVFNQVAVGVAVTDGSGRFLMSNERFREMVGRSSETLHRLQIADITDPEDLPHTERSLDRLLRTGESFAIEKRYVRPDGGTVWVNNSVAPVSLPDGDPAVVVAVVHDITERKNAEERLRQQACIGALGVETSSILGRSGELRDRLQQFAEAAVRNLEIASVQIWTLNEAEQVLALQAGDGLDTVANTTFTRIAIGENRIGRVAQERRLYFSNDLQSDSEFYASDWAVRQGLVALAGYPLVVDDRVVGVMALFAREPMSEDVVNGLAAIAESVAQFIDRKRIDAELHRRVDELALTNQRKDEFLAMLAHELRNPLAPIRNAVQLMRLRGSADGGLVQARDIVERQVAQMSRLLDDLLEVSRVTRGEFRLRCRPTDLRQVVRNAIETSRPMLDAKQQSLSVELPSVPIELELDAARMEQVVVNLLNNSARYTDPGGRISVSLAVESGPGYNDPHIGASTTARAVIRVRDTGIGIDQKTLPHIFDLFVQAERPLDRSQGGLGIGLTIVHRVVTMHGGTVEAHSDGPGRGSEFAVGLPCAVAKVDTQPQGPSAPRDVSTPKRRLQVLVVDDNVDAADTLGELVPFWGHDVRVAYDGHQALASIDGFRPDVVLLDIGLSGTDGYEVARQLRSEKKLDGFCLVAVTGYGQEEDRRRALEAGFECHLTKPVDPETLHAILDRVASE